MLLNQEDFVIRILHVKYNLTIKLIHTFLKCKLEINNKQVELIYIRKSVCVCVCVCV